MYNAILPKSLTAAVRTDLRLLLAMDRDSEGSSKPAAAAHLVKDSSNLTILATIEASKSTQMGRIDTLAIESGLIQQDLDKIKGHLSTAEVEDTAVTTHDNVAKLQRTVKLLMARSEDAENRLRCNNVRVVGLPKGSEGVHPTSFAESFFKEILSLTKVSSVYIVEGANRIPTGPRLQGSPPRPSLVCFLNYRDQDLLLAEARKHPHLR